MRRNGKALCVIANNLFLMLAGRILRSCRRVCTRSFATSLKDISIKGFFEAKKYAVIGASTKPGTLGHTICENYVRTYKGEAYFVNPKGILRRIGLKCRGRTVWKAHLQIGSRYSHRDRGSGHRRFCKVCSAVCGRMHEEGSQVRDHDSRRFQGV